MTLRGGLWVALLAVAACATPRQAEVGHLRITDTQGTALFNEQATFVLRNPEAVVTVRTLGEIHVGVQGDASHCRFVWSRDGLGALSILEGEQCPHLEGDRICFRHTRFAGNDHAGALVVDGCTWENDLKYSKLQGEREASVGPTSWRRRCVALARPAAGCDVNYLALLDAQVAENPAPRQGFWFSHDGDLWHACFLERDSGPYALQLWLEDSCGHTQRNTLRGDSHQLDD